MGRKLRARVLIVDDSPVNQKVIAHLVDSLGFQFDMAANGQEAVRMAEMCDYALILMDLRTPHMDGFTAARAIRESGNNVPIIGFSAYPMRDDADKCIDAGMNDFLEKPVNKGDFEETFKRWVSTALPKHQP